MFQPPLEMKFHPCKLQASRSNNSMTKIFISTLSSVSRNVLRYESSRDTGIVTVQKLLLPISYSAKIKEALDFKDQRVAEDPHKQPSVDHRWR